MQNVQPTNLAVTEPFEIIRWKNAVVKKKGQTEEIDGQDKDIRIHYVMIYHIMSTADYWYLILNNRSPCRRNSVQVLSSAPLTKNCSSYRNEQTV